MPPYFVNDLTIWFLKCLWITLIPVLLCLQVWNKNKQKQKSSQTSFQRGNLSNRGKMWETFKQRTRERQREVWRIPWLWKEWKRRPQCPVSKGLLLFLGSRAWRPVTGQSFWPGSAPLALTVGSALELLAEASAVLIFHSTERENRGLLALAWE